MGNVNISVEFDTAEWDDVRDGSEVNSGIVELRDNYAIVLNGTVVMQIEQHDNEWSIIDSVDTKEEIGVGSETETDRVALFALHMLSVSKEPQEYYSENKDIVAIDETFQENKFTGIIDFSDGTVQGEHYIGYVAGDRYSITVDNSGSLVCGADSFSRVENDVGIYKIFALDNEFESISFFELQNGNMDDTEDSSKVDDSAESRSTDREERSDDTDEGAEDSNSSSSNNNSENSSINVSVSDDTKETVAFESESNKDSSLGEGEESQDTTDDEIVNEKSSDEQISKLRAKQDTVEDVDNTSDNTVDNSSIEERSIEENSSVDEESIEQRDDVSQTAPDITVDVDNEAVLNEINQLQSDIDRLATQMEKLDRLESKMQKIDAIEQRIQNEFGSKLDDLIDLGLENSDMSQSELSDDAEDETFEGISAEEAIQSTNVQFRFNHSSNMNMMDIESLGGSALKTALDKMSVIPKSNNATELVNGVEYETFIDSALEYNFSSWVVKYLYLVLQEDDMPHIPSVLRLVPRLDQAEFMTEGDGPFDIVFYERDGGTPRSVVKTFTDDFVGMDDIKSVLGDGLDFATELEEEITVFILTDVSFEPTVRAELDKITEDKSLLWGQKKDSLVLPDSEEDDGEIQVCLVETHKDSFNLVYPD